MWLFFRMVRPGRHSDLNKNTDTIPLAIQIFLWRQTRLVQWREKIKPGFIYLPILMFNIKDFNYNIEIINLYLTFTL